MQLTPAILLLACAVHTIAAANVECLKASPCCEDRFSNAQLVEIANVQYGTATDLDGNAVVPLYMDVYEANALRGKPKPVMIVVHGGGFQQEFSNRAGNTVAESRAWARRGFLALAIEYRRWNGVINENSDNGERILTDPVHDVLAAVRYVVKENVSLGANPAYIGLSGSSAGGITVAHAVILNLGEGDSGNSGFPSKVRVGVSQSGGLSTYLSDKPTRMVRLCDCVCCLEGVGGFKL
jgi:acetyl esterase/lipase